MRSSVFFVLLLLAMAPIASAHGSEEDREGGQSSGGGKRPIYKTENPKIDMGAFLKTSRRAAAYRETRRISEDDFIAMSRDPRTVILDARSSELFDRLHVRGAINLSFPDISIKTLAEVLPDKNKRILIYCNNNFLNSEDAFPSKDKSASLNLSTFISLYSYGYRNIYELGPLLDVNTTKIPLVSNW